MCLTILEHYALKELTIPLCQNDNKCNKICTDKTTGVAKAVVKIVLALHKKLHKYRPSINKNDSPYFIPIGINTCHDNDKDKNNILIIRNEKNSIQVLFETRAFSTNYKIGRVLLRILGTF